MTQDNETGKSRLLTKYQERLENELEGKLQGKTGSLLFRGQEDADWPLQSSAAQRIRKFLGTAEKQPLPLIPLKIFLEYHEDFLEAVRKRGWGKNADGSRLNDLELLAKLRHFGAAVFLMDFTTRFDIALWFACQEVREKGDNQNPKSGKIFIVENLQTGLGEVRSDEIEEKEISYFFHPANREAKKTRQSKDDEKTNPSSEDAPAQSKISDQETQFWHWEPEILLDRMLSQESRFLFGPQEIPEGKYFSIEIDGEDKEGLLRELERKQGLRPESVFADIHGFATANTRGAPWKRKTPEEYFQEGMEEMRKGNWHDAITSLDEVLNLKPDHLFALALRGEAKRMLGRYQEAIQDFDAVFELDPHNWIALTCRGAAKNALGQYQEAIQDFDAAMEQNPNYPFALAGRGEAKRMLGLHQEAVQDFDAAIEQTPNYSFALASRGETKRMLGRYQEAFRDFDATIEQNPNHPFALACRGIAKSEMGNYEGAIADFDEAIRLKPDYGEAIRNREVALEKQREAVQQNTPPTPPPPTSP